MFLVTTNIFGFEFTHRSHTTVSFFSQAESLKADKSTVHAV